MITRRKVSGLLKDVPQKLLSEELAPGRLLKSQLLHTADMAVSVVVVSAIPVHVLA